MAIETTYFVNTTVAADNVTEVYAWLQSNAAEYFDSFAISDDGSTISCYIGELEALTISPGVNAGFTTTLINGTQKKTNAGTAATVICTKAVKTASGLAFGANNNVPCFFIAKAASGETLFVLGQGAALSVNFDWYAVVPTKDTAFTLCTNNQYSIGAKENTMLSPLACVNGTGYAPNLYSAPFNQYKGTEGIINLNGKQYYTNGYIALAD